MERLRSRRELLVEGALAAGGLAAADPLSSAARSLKDGRVRQRSPATPRDLVSHGAFASGVAAGRPGQQGALLWTRVDGLHKRGRVWLEVARSPDFRHVVDRRLVVVDPSTDYTVHHAFRSAKLRPGEELYYRFATRHESSPAGRFRTSRPADSNEPVRVAFFSCQAYQSGYYTAHRGLAQERDVDLVCGIGDYIYEQAGDKGGPRVDPLPNAQLLVYDKAAQGDHFLHFKNPVRFAADLETFLVMP